MDDLQRIRALAGIKLTESMVDEKAPPGMEDMVMKLKKEYPNDHSKAFATAWSIYNKKHGKKEESMEEAYTDVCNQDNPANAREACRMEEDDTHDFNLDGHMTQQETDITAWAIDRFRDMVDAFVDPKEAVDTIYRELKNQGATEQDFAEARRAIMSRFSQEDGGYDDGLGNESIDMEEESFDEAFDFNNGYDDTSETEGYSDYFPTGADSPVVSNAGPSGARQGDNPEQKKMQVSEVHKELVYGYRNYLKESKGNKKITK